MQILSKLNINHFNIKCCVQRKHFNNIRSFCHHSYQVTIAQGYKPKDVEKDKYKKWSQSKQRTETERPKFRIILPPPNVTGNLHLGHALMATVQDVICRQKRLLGYEVEWIPGMDHAGIATQVVVEKKLQKEKGLSRHDLGRNEFLKEVWKWKTEKADSIIDDLKRLGCSLDWSREYFTMDERQVGAVNAAFISLFDEGLIKMQKSLVNWSCSLESAISDIEVDTKEINGPTELYVPGYDKTITFGQLYNVSYRVFGKENEEVVVSTTRPETLLGDVAVAVHPEDQRYYQYRDTSTYLWHPFRNKPIPLIFDTSVDQTFGTGAVKITPAHDRNDFDMAQRHSLESVEVFTEKGTIRNGFQEFSDLRIYEARRKVLESLAAQHLLREIQPHTMILPLCSRSKDVIEYILRPQWFIHTQIMAEEAMKAVSEGNIRMHPKTFETEWFRWLNNCRDWCISRQLWWGHQIPAYLAKTHDNREVWVAAASEEDALDKARKQLNAAPSEISLQRDPDVLDTWFSSSLLPFSVFNWPDKEFRQSYPLDVMETGHDILFFWVARMAMLGLKLTGDVPFRNIVLNGIVCDAHGRKMSKSLGNVVTPQQVIYGSSLSELKDDIHKSYKSGVLGTEELKKSLKGIQKMFPSGIQECGTDALRFTLCSHNIKSHFINFDVSECHTNKLFLNKIWQATRYTLGAHAKLNIWPGKCSIEEVELGQMDKWILSLLSNTLETCAKSVDNYNLHTSVAALKTFFYTNFCDVYLETTKPGISGNTHKARAHCVTLSTCLSLGLRAMSPYTPFISEELQKYLPEPTRLDIIAYKNPILEEEINEILEVCQTIRQLKSRNNISKKHNPRIQLFPQNNNVMDILSKYLVEIQSLTLSNDVQINQKPATKKDFAVFSTAGHLCSFGISTNADYKPLTVCHTDVNRLKLEKLETELARYVERTSNEGFRKSASEAVQKKNLEKIKQLEIEIKNMQAMTS